MLEMFCLVVTSHIAYMALNKVNDMATHAFNQIGLYNPYTEREFHIGEE